MPNRFLLRLKMPERDYETSLLRLKMVEEESRAAADQMVALYNSAAASLLMTE
jgi:hypothetical protein